MSIPTNNGPVLSVNSIHNTPIQTLSKSSPFDNMDKPDWVASQGVSKGILIMLALIYSAVAVMVLILSFMGATFMYGPAIGIVVIVFTAAAIFMVWYVALYSKTISPVWKIAILIFEIIIMGFDVYVSAAGWNLSKISTFAEKRAYDRHDQYVKFYEDTKSVYGGVADLKEQSTRIADEERIQNGGKGQIFRIASATADRLSKDSLTRPLINPEIPTFTGKLTLKSLNSELIKYHDAFRSEEAELKSELRVTKDGMVDHKELTLEELVSKLNQYQEQSVRYLDKGLTSSIEQAQAVIDTEITAPEITSLDVRSVSNEGIKMRILSAIGLLFFLGLISILTWPRKRTRGGANDPFNWFEMKFIEYQVRRLHIPFGYTEHEALQTRFDATDDDLLQMISNETVRARIEPSGLTYRDLRGLYVELGRSAFQRLFTGNSGWTPQQINQLLDDPTYGPMVRLILQKLTYNQFAEVRLFRPGGGVADVVSRNDLVANSYAQVIVATKHRIFDPAQREAFIARFMSEDNLDEDFYKKLLHCINTFDTRQLNLLPVAYVNALLLSRVTELISLVDSTDGTFQQCVTQWTLADSAIIDSMIERSVFAPLAGLIEQGNRINPRLWTDIRNYWQNTIRVAGRSAVTINTATASTLSRATEEETIRTGLASVFYA